MVVMVSALRTAVSRSTLSVAALSRAGSLAASLVALEAAATPRLWHHARWVQATSALQVVASVVDSEVGLMVDAVVSVAAEAAVDSRTEEDLVVVVEAEVVSDMEVADLVAVTEVGVDLAATVGQTVDTAHRHLMLQLDQEEPDLVSKVHHLVVSVPEATARVPQTAMGLLRVALVVIAAADHLTKTVDRLVATEAVIAAMVTAAEIAIAEDIVQHEAEATWSQFARVSHARMADIATEILEITTWV